MAHRRSSKGFIALFTLGMAYVLLSMDWRGQRPPRPPRVLASARAHGEWSAGAAKAPLVPALPTAVAGYPPPRPTAQESGPLFARALALRAGERTVALAAAEVLEIPAPVAQRVRERGRALGLDEVVVAATHAHSSFGGYDRNPLVQVAATGRFARAREDLLVDALAEALAGAARALAPARLAAAQVRLPGVSANRNGGIVDDRLTALLAEAGAPVARLAVFGSHATLAPRKAERLDGDWPGRAMARLEEGGGVGLLLQGAMGDTTSRPAPGEGAPEERMAAAVAAATLGALETATAREGRLAWATVELDLPRAAADHAVPRFLRLPAANLLHAVAPRTAQVVVLRLPGLALLCTPAEPTAAAALEIEARLRPRLGPEEQVAFVSLAQGYVGYLETAAATRQGAGEGKRTIFGPELLERVAAGLEAGLDATAAAEAAAP